MEKQNYCREQKHLKVEIEHKVRLWIADPWDKYYSWIFRERITKTSDSLDGLQAKNHQRLTITWAASCIDFQIKVNLNPIRSVQ